MAGRQHNHRRTIRDERGRPLRSINVCEAEKVRLDREERLWRAMRDADSMAIGGPLRMDEMMAVAGLHGKRSCYHDSERYSIVGLIGNFADHANEKFEQYADVHDRRAVTVRADHKIWIPDAHQATKRAKRYAQGAKN